MSDLGGGTSQHSQAPSKTQMFLGDAEERQKRMDTCRERVANLLAVQPLDKPKHVSQFFTNIEYKSVGSQQLHGACMFCNRIVHSTGAARLLDHLLECPICVPEVQVQCKALRDKANGKRKQKAEESALVVCEAEQQVELIKAQKKEFRQQSIRSGFRSAESEVADRAIAEFFYANALPFSIADTSVDSYYMQMVNALRATPSSYVPPSSKKIAGPLLETCHQRMLANIEARDANSVLSDKFGVAYTQDGWDSVDHLPLINSAYITANDGGVYQRSVDTSGFIKDAEYIASLMITDIYSIGCTKVVMVITDTCSTMQKAWAYVEDEFPWITAAPCIPHVASLLMKDVGKIPEVSRLVADETLVVGWFANHQKPLAILREKVRSLLNKSCELIKAGATRFGTHTLVGERLQQLKAPLQATVVDPTYVAQNYKDLPDDHDLSNCETRTRQNKGGTAKALVLDDGGFWKRVDDHVLSTLPIYKLLRRHDSSAPTVGKVYHGFYSVGEHIKATNVSYKDAMAKAHDERWLYGHNHFFAAAYALDPEFISHQVSSNSEVMDGLVQTVERLSILFEVRRLQKMDGR